MCASAACHDLRDRLLLLIELRFDEELRKHEVDSIQLDVRVSHLVLSIETIPDIADGAVVLYHCTHGLDGKGDQGSRMNMLPFFYA